MLHEETSERDIETTNDDEYGVDKMEAPSHEGLAAAVKAANAFATASDGQNTDVDLAINIRLPKDTSGFNESFSFDFDDNDDLDEEDPMTTMPAVPEEDDQFSDSEDQDAAFGDISDAELASDIDESFTGYDDLY